MDWVLHNAVDAAGQLHEPCGAEARWIADIGWLKDTSAYEGTSWNVALCEPHYEQLRGAGRITGTPHEASD